MIANFVNDIQIDRNNKSILLALLTFRASKNSNTKSSHVISGFFYRICEKSRNTPYESDEICSSVREMNEAKVNCEERGLAAQCENVNGQLEMILQYRIRVGENTRSLKSFRCIVNDIMLYEY